MRPVTAGIMIGVLADVMTDVMTHVMAARATVIGAIKPDLLDR